MAMQKYHVIKETHHKHITALLYNPLKHEIVVGFEDGVLKTWDCVGDNFGKLSKTCHEHEGWINCFVYWNEMKLLLSAGNDGKIIAWGSSMLPASVVKIGTPIYAMAWNTRRNQLVLGLNSAVKVYTLRDPAKDGKVLSKKSFTATEHTDLVKGIVCHETRVYSVGYDQKLCIYDSYSYPEKKGLKLVSCLYPAHDAGITTLKIAKDNENNTWLMTGAFDKTVKIWSQDGQIMHKFDGFAAAVTSISYVVPTRTVWIAAGVSDVPMYDPKSGDNVSEFVSTFQSKDQDSGRYFLSLFQYIPDLNQVIATDSRRQILIYKYNPAGCIITLKHNTAVECLTYTKKVPMLVFSGNNTGQINKWEQLQSNTFMYSNEILPRAEAVAQLASQIVDKHHYVNKNANQVQENIAVMRLLFVEEMDLLLVASEDHNIYVWGFDNDAVDALQNMHPQDNAMRTNKFAFLLGNDSSVKNADKPKAKLECDSVTNRVAGFICKTVFTAHTQCVSGLAAGKGAGYNTMYLISASWDRRILIWDLEKMSFHDVFRNDGRKNKLENEELAADGIITDLVYCEERNEFAYSSSDKLVYIRQFSEVGSNMKLKAVLQGHEGDVTQIRWNSIHQKWISGSEDCTIRVWSADGLSCDLVFSSHGTVNALCIDESNGCIVAGIENVMRVYDIETKSIVQTNVGHTDSIRYLIHMPERQEYVSASWDTTVRVWNAYRKAVKKKSSLTEIKLKK